MQRAGQIGCRSYSCVRDTGCAIVTPQMGRPALPPPSQFHAVALLHALRATDRLAISKLVSTLTKANVKSPLAQCLVRWPAWLLKLHAQHACLPWTLVYERAHGTSVRPHNLAVCSLAHLSFTAHLSFSAHLLTCLSQQMSSSLQVCSLCSGLGAPRLPLAALRAPTCQGLTLEACARQCATAPAAVQHSAHALCTCCLLRAAREVRGPGHCRDTARAQWRGAPFLRLSGELPAPQDGDGHL